MTTPSRAALANDLGERCQIIVGNFGYVAKADMPPRTSWLKLRPQASVNLGAQFISSDQYLTMRDYDRFSRVVVTDWTKGAYQVTFDPSTKADLSRFYDSANVDVSTEGEFSLIRAFSALQTGDTNASSKPMVIAQQYLYVASQQSVKYSASNSWAAPTTAATNTTGSIGSNVTSLTTDGQYVYGYVSSGGGAGINRWAIGSSSAATLWNNTITSANRGSLIFANRRIYSGVAATFYEVALASGTGTSDFVLPTGWIIQDICALRGGSIDAPILILATNGTSATAQSSAIWYWDGVTVHDYMTLPNGFSATRMKQYLGVIYITGHQLMPSSKVSVSSYAIIDGNLKSLGLIAGLVQSNGDPSESGAAGYATPMDFFGTGAYFGMVNTTTSKNEIWRYDIINGGWTRFAQPSATTLPLVDVIFWQNGLWFSYQDDAISGGGLYGQQSAFVTSGTLTNSDLNLGQPWSSNVWATLELTFAPLAAGEAVAIAYSTDGGATFTSTDVNGTTMSTTTLAAKQASWLISNTSSSVITPYIRPKMTLTAGTSQATTPSFYSVSIKAIPAQPPGVVIEAWLACADQTTMPNGQADWQGASGAERLYNIMNLYATQALTNVIYMAPGQTRAKNPTTLSCVIDDYDIFYYPSVGFRPGAGPPIGVEGDVRVVLRQVTSS